MQLMARTTLMLSALVLIGAGCTRAGAPQTPATSGGGAQGDGQQTSSPASPYIKVISPNGGEQFCIGKPMTIKWESQGIPEVSVSVMQYDPGGGGAGIFSKNVGDDTPEVADTNEFVWDSANVRREVKEGRTYGILIMGTAGPDGPRAEDVSDQYFTLRHCEESVAQQQTPSAVSPSVAPTPPTATTAPPQGQPRIVVADIFKNPNRDSDGDGITDKKELEKGTNPSGTGKLLPSMIADEYTLPSEGVAEYPVKDEEGTVWLPAAKGELIIMIEETPASSFDYLFSKYPITLAGLVTNFMIIVRTADPPAIIAQLTKEPNIMLVDYNHLLSPL